MIIGTRNVNLLLVSGQSNAGGQSQNLSTVTSPLQASTGAKIWVGSRGWKDMRNGANNGALSNNGEYWGPEAEFARQWSLERRERLHILKHAVGATDLAAYWAASGGTGFNAMKTYATSAKSALTAAGFTVTCIGLLWMQGEADSLVQASANAYQANLTAFFAGARLEWGSANMPIVVGRIADQSGWTYRTAVRAGQAAAVAADAHAALVDTDSYGTDGVHYNTTGMVSMGADMYAAWKTLAG